MKKLFPARIRCLQGTQVRKGIGAVDGINKGNTGLPVQPGVLHQKVKELLDGNVCFFCLEHRAIGMTEHLSWLHFLSFKGAEPGFVWTLLHLLHKLVSHGHGNVEVADFSFLSFAGDKVQDIGVVHPHHGHIGAVTSLLFNGAKSGIIHPQKRNGA